MDYGWMSRKVGKTGKVVEVGYLVLRIGKRGWVRSMHFSIRLLEGYGRNLWGGGKELSWSWVNCGSKLGRIWDVNNSDIARFNLVKNCEEGVGVRWEMFYKLNERPSEMQLGGVSIGRWVNLGGNCYEDVGKT